MNSKLARLMFAGSMALTAGLSPAHVAYALDEEQKKEFGEFIREYLIENPEILFEVQDAMQAKQDAQQKAKAGEAISSMKDLIFAAADDLVLGNPDGDVTVVEFYDYNCGYCKRAVSDMQDLISKDSNLRFVLKEFPILGPDSVAAHRVAVAFRALSPEKYGEFHMALMTNGGHADDASAIAVAESLGVDEAAIRAQLEKDNGDGTIRSSYALAQELGINGTPAYVVGSELMAGAVGSETLTAKVENMRQCGETTC